MKVGNHKQAKGKRKILQAVHWLGYERSFFPLGIVERKEQASEHKNHLRV